MTDSLYTLYSTGYTGRTPEDILTIAHTYNAMIVDIRIHPRSRVNHWNGYALRSYLERNGRQYHHIEALGNINYLTPGRPVEIKDPEMGCFELRGLLKKQSCVILCACKCPDECHRTKVAGLMNLWHGTTCIEIQRKDEPNHEQLDQLTLF